MANQNKNEEAKKFDKEKVRFDLLPWSAVEGVADVFTYGASKYGAYNWSSGAGLRYSRLISASFRHMYSWMMGEDIDPESGKNHLAHVAANVLMLLDYEINKIDDRQDDRQGVVRDDIKTSRMS